LSKTKIKEYLKEKPSYNRKPDNEDRQDNTKKNIPYFVFFRVKFFLFSIFE
jgi:hypothetical protein